MQDIDNMVKRINLVLELHQGSALVIQEIANKSENMYDMYIMVRDLYYKSVVAALNEIPSNSLGHALIQELCMGLPSSVFDELASNYWHAYKEEA
jgi:hypothetical protein